MIQEYEIREIVRGLDVATFPIRSTSVTSTFARINPFRVVPVIRDDSRNVIVKESSAIFRNVGALLSNSRSEDGDPSRGISQLRSRKRSPSFCRIHSSFDLDDAHDHEEVSEARKGRRLPRESR